MKQASNRFFVLSVALGLLVLWGQVQTAAGVSPTPTTMKTDGREQPSSVPSGSSRIPPKVYEAGPLDAEPGTPEYVVSPTPRFVIYPGKVIHDMVTGLDWVAGPDKDMTFEQAEHWVNSRTDGGGGWRMPAQDELFALYKNDSTGRNIVFPAFWTGFGWFVWTEGKEGDKNCGFNFFDGNRSSRKPGNMHRNRALAVREECKRPSKDEAPAVPVQK
jgi:hypothetical protein